MKYPNIIIIEEKEVDPPTIILNHKVLIVPDAISIRSGGELKGKALYLPNYIKGFAVNWIIIKDSAEELCCVPFKKEI